MTLEQNSFDYLCSQFLKVKGSLLLSENQTSRTILSNHHIQQGQVIMTIPYKYFINYHSKMVSKSHLRCYLEVIEKNANKSQCYEEGQMQEQQDLKQFFRIMNSTQSVFHYTLIYLIEIYHNFCDCQTQAGSIHKQYVNLLPQDYSFHPLLLMKDVHQFHFETYQKLKTISNELQQIVVKLKKIIQNEYFSHTFRSFLDANGQSELYDKYLRSFTTQSITWACLTLYTRQFFGNNLIPLLDLFNHSTSKQNVSWKFDPKQEIVSLFAMKKIQQGEQLLVSYGNESSQILFQIYGFLQQGESWKISIPPKSSKSNKYFCVKTKEYKNFPHRSKNQLNKYFEKENFDKEAKIQFSRCCQQMNVIRCIRINKLSKLIESTEHKSEKQNGSVKSRLKTLISLRKINENERQMIKILIKQMKSIVSTP